LSGGEDSGDIKPQMYFVLQQKIMMTIAAIFQFNIFCLRPQNILVYMLFYIATIVYIFEALCAIITKLGIACQGEKMAETKNYRCILFSGRKYDDNCANLSIQHFLSLPSKHFGLYDFLYYNNTFLKRFVPLLLN
jgi:hypothetical protein